MLFFLGCMFGAMIGIVITSFCVTAGQADACKNCMYHEKNSLE